MCDVIIFSNGYYKYITPMYRPELKRGSLGYQNEEVSTNQFTRKPTVFLQQSISSFSAKEKALVPDAFFENNNNIVLGSKIEGLTGAINTFQLTYPSAVLQDISSEDSGNVQFHDGIFCFHKGKRLHFWRYKNNTFTQLFKYLLHECSDVITAVCYKYVYFSQFGGASILLISLSFGTSVKFYSLTNFDLEDQNGLPHLADLMIAVYSPGIVTQIIYIYEESDESPDKNTLAILLGDSNGNLLLFDFVTKRKYLVDSMRQKLQRQIKKQSYSQIRQILVYKQYAFCLVDRYYEAGTLWKFLHKITKNCKSDVLIEQKLEIYQIEKATHIYKRMVFRQPNVDARITGFVKYGDYSVQSIIHKIKSSHSQYFENKYELNYDSLSTISSLSIRGECVELMFTSGESILVDQDIAFAGRPIPCPKKPASFNLLSRCKTDLDDNLIERVSLLKSAGSKLMLFQDFLISKQEDCVYFSPYIPKTSSFYIRSIKQIGCKTRNPCFLQDLKFVVLGHKNFTLVQPLTPFWMLFLYCAIMYEQYPHRRMIPQVRLFEDNLDKIAEYFGQSQLLVTAIQILLRARAQETLQIGLRMDLFELVSKEVSNRYQTSFKQAIKSYEQTDKSLMKNIEIRYSKNIEELIYKAIFRFQKVKVELTKRNAWQINEVQAICVALQVVISEIFNKIKGWTARTFCTKRNQIYKIISIARVLDDILQNYLHKEIEKNYTNKGNLFNENFMKHKIQLSQFLDESQSFKTIFCQYSKFTVEKVILLLKVYDFVCEMDFHSTSIPKFTDLVLNSSQSKRVRFSETVLRTVGLNNDGLIDLLVRKVPQLRIDQIRKFNSWRKFHQSKRCPNFDDPNDTTDSIGEQEAEELSDFIDETNFNEIRRYYLHPTVEERVGINKESAVRFASGAAVLLRACLKKVFELRSQQIQKSNIVAAYKKSVENYFGVLQISNIDREISEVLKEIEFMTLCCHQILEQVFEKYAKNRLDKQQIRLVLDSTRGLLTIEVRRDLQKILERLNLSELLHILDKRQLFKSKGNLNKKSEFDSNFVVQQLYDDVSRKYA